MRLMTAITGLTLLLLTGCAQNKYNWNGYDKGLYDAYKDPNQVVALQIKLQETVDALEKEKQVVPRVYMQSLALYISRREM